MPLIRNGETVENTWTFFGVEDEISYTEGGTSLTLARFLNEADAAITVNTPIGVRLSPEIILLNLLHI